MCFGKLFDCFVDAPRSGFRDRPHSGLWHTPLCGVCHTPLCTVARGMVFVVFERASVPRCFSLSVGRFFVLREHYVIVFERIFVKTYQMLFQVVMMFSKVSH